MPGVLLGLVVHTPWVPGPQPSTGRLYMGDAGSNFLGFLLGASTVAGTYYRYGEGQSKLGVLAPLLVMAVPLYDACSVVLIRLREGRSPFEADRRHFSHRLVDCGLTPTQAVRTIHLMTLCGGLGAFVVAPAGRGRRNRRRHGESPDVLGVGATLELSVNAGDPIESEAGAMARRPTRNLDTPELDPDVLLAARVGKGLRRLALGSPPRC